MENAMSSDRPIGGIQVVNYFTSAGQKTALVEEKRLRLKILVMDGKLTVRHVPKEEQRHMRPLARLGKPYPIRRAVAHFRTFGKGFGITPGARKYLARAYARGHTT